MTGPSDLFGAGKLMVSLFFNCNIANIEFSRGRSVVLEHTYELCAFSLSHLCNPTSTFGN